MKKRVVFAMSAVFAVCALAAEPGKQLLPALPGSPPLVAPLLPESLLKQLDPDGSLGLRDNPGRVAWMLQLAQSSRPQVCYFMRTTQPVPAAPAASRNGFIPLQAVTTAFVKKPDCTSDAFMMRAIPAKREIAAQKDGDSRARD